MNFQKADVENKMQGHVLSVLYTHFLGYSFNFASYKNKNIVESYRPVT